MSFFSIFRKQSQSPAAPPEEPNPSTADKKDDIIVIPYGTGMPIDVIYGFISKDYEKDGYDDALINSSAEYCKSKENIILNDLNILFDRILLRYNDDMRIINVKIDNAKNLFAVSTASVLEARRQTCIEHIAEIQRMKAKYASKDPEIMTMIESYRRGFARGCAAQTATFLNI